MEISEEEREERRRKARERFLKEMEERSRLNGVLLQRIKDDMPALQELLDRFSGEDLPYRFYHQSFKVQRTQELLEDALAAFRKIAGADFTLNEWYLQIHSDGLVGLFQDHHNRDWLKYNRPRMEAYFHTKFFLEMMVKYGQELEEAPNLLPSGWAMVLYLFNVR